MDASKLLEVAASQIGKEEIPRGSNWGPDVKAYLASVGINFPASWCMAYVYWCVNRASLQLGITNPMHKSGGVLAVWNQMKAKNGKTSPAPGDIFIMDYGKGLGHTGIVEKVYPDYVETIEGNTNDTGSREGYEVCRRKRPINKIKGFIRLS